MLWLLWDGHCYVEGVTRAQARWPLERRLRLCGRNYCRAPSSSGIIFCPRRATLEADINKPAERRVKRAYQMDSLELALEFGGC